jgi:integrase
MSPRPEGRQTIGAFINVTPGRRLRLNFRWPRGSDGKLYRVTTDYRDTPQNRRELERIRDLVGAEIRAGTFVLGTRFPSLVAPKIALPPLTSGTPKLAADLAAWIEEKRLQKVRRSRLREYESHRKNYITTAPIGTIATKVLALVHFQAFQLWLVSKAGENGTGVSEKTAANVVRGTLQAFIRDRGTPEQIVAIRSLRWERYKPGRQQDGFDAEERDSILAWFRANRPLDEAASIALRFQGITPSETRALRVGDFDRATSSVHVTQSEDEGEIAATKAENRIRLVDLPRELGADLATLAGLREPAELLIRGIRNERALIYQWTRAQKAVGIRFRPVYQAKHTYANLALRAGEAGIDVARHLGITEATLMKHYGAAAREGRHIRSAGNATENATAPRSSKFPSKIKSGRRGLNPRPSRWQRDVLPLNYSRVSGKLGPFSQLPDSLSSLRSVNGPSSLRM